VPSALVNQQTIASVSPNAMLSNQVDDSLIVPVSKKIQAEFSDDETFSLIELLQDQITPSSCE